MNIKPFKQLVEDNLPKFEKKFNEYLQETIQTRLVTLECLWKLGRFNKGDIRLLNEIAQGNWLQR